MAHSDTDLAVEVSYCPACAEPMDYCQGHGEIGDPAGFAILQRHDDDDHSDCVGECAEDWTEDRWTDAEADADTLASAGWGTDEDYGLIGGDSDLYGEW